MEFEPNQRFVNVASVPEAEINLARAALEIARDEYSDLDPRVVLDELDELAARVGTLAGESPNPLELLRAVNTCLFTEFGLSGNLVEYSDPRNSYLNDVLQRKVGIPITLSVVYLEVAWRLGLPAVGVSFPGHFLVKCHIGDSLVVVDPFHGGQSLDEAALLARLRGVVGDRDDLAGLLPRFLGEASKRDILVRMLRNLKLIFTAQEQFDRALVASNKICLLAPDLPEELRDRGFIFERLDCFSAALADYRQYLTLAPGAPDAIEVKQRLLKMEQQTARLN